MLYINSKFSALSTVSHSLRGFQKVCVPRTSCEEWQGQPCALGSAAFDSYHTPACAWVSVQPPVACISPLGSVLFFSFWILFSPEILPTERRMEMGVVLPLMIQSTHQETCCSSFPSLRCLKCNCCSALLPALNSECHCSESCYFWLWKFLWEPELLQNGKPVLSTYGLTCNTDDNINPRPMNTFYKISNVYWMLTGFKTAGEMLHGFCFGSYINIWKSMFVYSKIQFSD